MDFSRQGTPTDNSHTGSCHVSFQDACLNLYGFASMAEENRHAEAWRRGLERESSSHGSQWTSLTGMIRPL